MAPLSNAERQKLHRQRLAERARQGVTPEDVRRAVRLNYERASAPDDEPFEKWVAGLRPKRDAALWALLVPVDPDPHAYSDLASDDAALMLKVAAVVRAVKLPRWG